MRRNSQGGLVISVLLIVAIMVIGYIVISNVLETKEAQTIQNATEETVDRVNDAREQLETTKQSIEDSVDATTEIIENATP